MEKLDKTFCPTYYIGWARTNSAIQTKSEEAASVNIGKCHEKEMAEKHASKDITIYVRCRNAKISFLVLQFSAPYPPISV